MNGYALHPEAFADLDDIREHMAQHNPTAAERVILPYQGYQRPNLTSRPLRFKVVREYVIAYAPERIPLWVVAVFHGRRRSRVMAAILQAENDQSRFTTMCRNATRIVYGAEAHTVSGTHRFGFHFWSPVTA